MRFGGTQCRFKTSDGCLRAVHHLPSFSSEDFSTRSGLESTLFSRADAFLRIRNNLTGQLADRFGLLLCRGSPLLYVSRIRAAASLIKSNAASPSRRIVLTSRIATLALSNRTPFE